ncbi:MAG TPA: hypothetical protein VKC17_07220 [Sphingomicrobium sp.]|nr:hypothetical protein [Sphingomicrobium sp.]
MRTLPIVVGLSLAGCAGPVVPPGDASAGVTAGRVAGPPQSCISTSSSEGLHAIDSATLAYGSGSTIYINRLGYRCPGLRDLSTIITEVRGGQYCRGDHIRALEPGSIIPGPSCNLGDWVPYRR